MTQPQSTPGPDLPAHVRSANPIRVGFLGAGRMAQTLARLFLRAGHDVVLANSREPTSLTDVIAALDPGASAVRAAELRDYADILVLAVPWARIPDALRALGDVRGLILIDTTNNRVGPRPQDVIDLGGRGSSEVVAALAPSARVVKAFNHQPVPALTTIPEAEPPRALFIAGDDAAAKEVVAQLIRAIGGVPVDTETLREGGRLQGTGTGSLAGHGRLLSVAEATEALDAARGSPQDTAARASTPSHAASHQRDR